MSKEEDEEEETLFSSGRVNWKGGLVIMSPRRSGSDGGNNKSVSFVEVMMAWDEPALMEKAGAGSWSLRLSCDTTNVVG